MSLFTGAAGYYRRYRPGIPAEVADMLASADTALRGKLAAGATLMLGESTAEAFTPPDGWTADLVTICRAFHWLDQAPVLAQLDHHGTRPTT